MSIEYILNATGKPVGIYDYTSGLSLPIEDDPKPEAQKPEPVYPTPDAKKEISFWQRYLNVASHGGQTGGAAACGGNSAVKPNLNPDGGVVLVPPTDIPDGGTPTPSGAVIFGPLGRDGTVFLPIDPNGNIILPDDIWFEIDGEGSFFQETPWIVLGLQEAINTPGLHNLNLKIEFGTDSTKIAGMPADGCFDGLINVGQFSDADLDAGVIGCPDPGYEKFVVCPSQEENRLKLYLAGYRIDSSKLVGGQVVDAEVGTDYVTTTEQLYTDPASVPRVGVVCSGSPAPNSIQIPKEFYNDNTLNITVKLRKVVDARPADSNTTYKTFLRARLIEGSVADGGTD